MPSIKTHLAFRDVNIKNLHLEINKIRQHLCNWESAILSKMITGRRTPYTAVCDMNLNGRTRKHFSSTLQFIDLCKNNRS